MHPKEEAARGLINNRRQAEQIHNVPELKHTPPSPEHYLHKYLWDSAFFVIMYAQTARQLFSEGRFEEAAGYRKTAQEELTAVLEGQHQDGMIPNVQFIKEDRAWDFERLFALDRQAKCSNYTQPPVLALAATEVFTSCIEAGDFEAYENIEAVYPPLKKFFGYLDKERSNGPTDKLIGVIHPHETGRDSDPTFDFIKKLRIGRKGPETGRSIDTANTAIDYLSIIWHGVKLHRKARGNAEKARQIFWVNDVMMNCIYVDNLRQMAILARNSWREEEAEHYECLAEQVEARILGDEGMWSPDARDGQGAFYALDKNKEPLKQISISNLFPLSLPNLRPEQLESLLNLMDSSFDAPYPLPSVATDSPNYDPHNGEKERLWRGPTWMNTNWYVVTRGLYMQAGRQGVPAQLRARAQAWAERISKASNELLDSEGPCEHYDAEIGRGQRRRVKDFGWSWLARFM